MKTGSLLCPFSSGRLGLERRPTHVHDLLVGGVKEVNLVRCERPPVDA